MYALRKLEMPRQQKHYWCCLAGQSQVIVEHLVRTMVNKETPLTLQLAFTYLCTWKKILVLFDKFLVTMTYYATAGVIK